VGHLRNRLQQLRAPLKSRPLTLLLTAQLLSGLGDFAARVALGILVLEKTDSAALSGLVLTVSVLPWVGIGQVLATLGDRLPRKQLMIACDLIRAAAFAAMLIPMPVAVIFVLAFIAALPTPPFAAARSALLPETVPTHQYPDALALSTIISQSAQVLGYLIGGVLVALVSARGALLVNALSFAVSALVLAGLKVGRTPTAKSNRILLREGATAIWNDPMVRRALLFLTSVNLGAIIPESLAAVYALKHLGSSDTTAGVLAAAIALGMIVIVSVVPLEHRNARYLLRAAGVLAACGAAASLVLFGLDLDLPLIVLAFAAVGVTLGSAVPTNTVFGTRVANESRASAFGLAMGTLLAGEAVGAAIGALLVSLFSVRAACIVGMAFVLGVGLWGMFTAPHEREPGKRTPPAPPPQPVAIADTNGGSNGDVDVDFDVVERQPPAPPPRPVQRA
jgi:MFS family permease